MDHVSQRKKKPFHDSRVLKKQFHGKLDSNKIIYYIKYSALCTISSFYSRFYLMYRGLYIGYCL